MSKVFFDDNDVFGSFTISEDKLTVTASKTIRSSIGTNKRVEARKWYAEIEIIEGTELGVGVYDGKLLFKDGQVLSARRYYTDYQTYENNTPIGFKNGDILSLLIDMDSKKMSVMKNGQLLPNDILDLSAFSQVKIAMVNLNNITNPSIKANFGKTPFMYKIPEGYKPYDWIPQDKILLLSGNKGKKIEQKELSAVPEINANIQDGFKVTSSIYPEIAYKAFQSNDEVWGANPRRVHITGWIQIEFPSIINISKFSLTSYVGKISNYAGWGIKDFKVFTGNSEDSLSLVYEGVQPATIANITYELPSKLRTKFFRIEIISTHTGPDYYTFGIEKLTIFKEDSIVFNLNKQFQQSFIEHGMSPQELSEIDFSSDLQEKHYINDQSTPLGSGKVFEQPLDVDKIIKSINIK